MVDTVRDLRATPTRGDFRSVCVISSGEYGTPAGIITSLPIKVDAVGKWRVVEGHEADRLRRGARSQASNEELLDERELAFGSARLEHLVLHPQSCKAGVPVSGRLFLLGRPPAPALRFTLSRYTGFQPVHPRFVASVRAGSISFTPSHRGPGWARLGAAAVRGVSFGHFFTDDAQALPNIGLGHGVIDAQAFIAVSPVGVVAEEK